MKKYYLTSSIADESLEEESLKETKTPSELGGCTVFGHQLHSVPDGRRRRRRRDCGCLALDKNRCMCALLPWGTSG